MKRNLVIITILLAAISAYGQGKYLTKEGYIKFYSHTAIEDITAENNEVAGIIDAETGEVVINVRMTAFQFEKKLMQEHFNENYVESEKYPKAVFKGMITNNGLVNYKLQGYYNVTVEGEMTIHGESNPVRTNGTIEVTEKGIVASTKFMLNPENYGVKIPRLVRKNIAEEMEITVDMDFKPM
jgi:polyisoprenoid-binding protein YceI